GLAALAVCALLLVAVVTYLIRAVARPVRHAASASARIATGDLTTRLPVAGPTEVHELADSFNTMAGSLESGRRALERQNEEVRLHVGSSQAIEIDVPELLGVRGDRTRIAQVLNNLVANAVKYSPADGRITVSGAGDGAVARITVSDQGFGIAEEHQPHVFTK